MSSMSSLVLTLMLTKMSDNKQFESLRESLDIEKMEAFIAQYPQLKGLPGPMGAQGIDGATGPSGLTNEDILTMIDMRLNERIRPLVKILQQVEKILRDPVMTEISRKRAHQKVEEFNDLIKNITDE